MMDILQIVLTAAPPMFVSGMAVLSMRDHFLIADKTRELTKAMNGKLYKFIDRTLTDIEEVTVLRIKDVAKKKWLEHACEHGETELTCKYFGAYFPNEVGKAVAMVHNALTKHTRSAVIQHLDINGFMDKSEKDLQNYINDVGAEIHADCTRALRIMGMDDIDLVVDKTATWFWFSRDEAQAQYGKVVRECIRLKRERDAKVDKYRKEISRFRKAIHTIKQTFTGGK